MKLVFDTETTGFFNAKIPKTDPAQARCVQLGAILFDENDIVRGELNVIIKPDGWTVPAAAANVHGITTEIAEKYGIPIAVAMSVFNRFVSLSDTLIAHNFPFDDGILQGEFQRLARDTEFTKKKSFCTMKASTDICKIPGPRGVKWPSLMEAHEFFFKEKFEGAHDAMADVRACKRVYQHLQKTYGEVKS